MNKLVSVIIPCFNEENTILKLLDSILNQTYEKKKLEVIISDGMSTDNTIQIINSFTDKNKNLNIKIFNNENRTIPSAINLAINNSSGEIILRLDAHCIPYPDYVENCVLALENNLADVVGGNWEIKPGNETLKSLAISFAVSHPLGAGDAKYRLNSKSGYVDTVPFGAFYKSLIDKIGFYDENLLTNEDYEFNTRVINSGGKIWLDSKIRIIYFARKNYLELMSQYFRYGFWKYKMLKQYPTSIKMRQILPPLFITFILVFGILSLSNIISTKILFLIILFYLFLLIFSSTILALKNKEILLLIYIPISFALIQFSWGIGFIRSIFKK